MTDLRTTAQQALAHVQEFKRRWMAVPPFGNKVNKATREAVTLAHVPVLQIEEALKAALEQPEQEPHWLTKELMADYLDMIAEAIEHDSSETLLHKAYWMRNRGEI